MSDTNKSQSHSCNRATKRYTPQPHPIGTTNGDSFFYDFKIEIFY